MALRDALDLLDALDTGDHVQDFYFLRHRDEGTWACHYRTPGKGDWRVSRDARLSIAIENALIDMEQNPYEGQEYRHGTHDITPDEGEGEDWMDLI
tara:strand:+ start:15977 stop:16264 length:288 start_codon:yes stop_codon:yes gene_type:complete